MGFRRGVAGWWGGGREWGRVGGRRGGGKQGGGEKLTQAVEIVPVFIECMLPL